MEATVSSSIARRRQVRRWVGRNRKTALLLLPWVSSAVVTGCLVACEIDRSPRRRGCGRPEGRPYNTTGSGSVGAMLASPTTPLRSPTTVRSGGRPPRQQGRNDLESPQFIAMGDSFRRFLAVSGSVVANPPGFAERTLSPRRGDRQPNPPRAGREGRYRGTPSRARAPPG